MRRDTRSLYRHPLDSARSTADAEHAHAASSLLDQLTCCLLCNYSTHVDCRHRPQQHSTTSTYVVQRRSNGAKSRAPRVQGLRPSSMLYGSLVHVGETFNRFGCRFGAVNCTKMRLAAGLRPDPLGEYSSTCSFITK